MLLLIRTLPGFVVDDFFLDVFVVYDVFLLSVFLTTIEQFLNKYRKRINEWIYEFKITLPLIQELKVLPYFFHPYFVSHISSEASTHLDVQNNQNHPYILQKFLY